MPLSSRGPWSWKQNDETPCGGLIRPWSSGEDYGFWTLCSSITSCLISAGTFGTTFSLKKASCCSFVSQTSATQKPWESSNATWSTKPGCFLISSTNGGEISSY